MTMPMLPFLITLTVLVALIVCGVLLSSYLYSRGALRAGRRLKHATYDVGYSRSGATDKEMSDYVRKSIFILLGTIIALFVLVAIILSSFH